MWPQSKKKSMIRQCLLKTFFVGELDLEIIIECDN